MADSQVFTGEETWTGKITRIRESGGVIDAFKFVGTDEQGNPVDEWVDAGTLTAAEQDVIRRLKDGGATDVVIGVKDAVSSSDYDKVYTGEIEYSPIPSA